ncbi:unnamed protein product [Rotaria socialis]|uniref:Uncharacterized protein n=3 Tax=Rotaria socialis TaxID=392032 RepID=A0A818UTG2_9BILA|nr:unnamed protein product [Rotaria socialis]CAF3702899.1 unnamed protein product [Rotaria socialis]
MQLLSTRIFLGMVLIIVNTVGQDEWKRSMTAVHNSPIIKHYIQNETIVITSIGRFKYQDGEVILLKNKQKASEFFFTPFPYIEPNYTACNYNDFSGRTELTLVLSLYTTDLLESIESHIKKHQKICRTEHCSASLLPMHSIRLFEKGNRTKESQIKYTLDNQWYSNTPLRQTMEFIIYTLNMSICESFQDSIISRCRLPNFEIQYSLDTQQTTSRNVEVTTEHITSTSIYTQIKSQFHSNAQNMVALTENAYKNLLSETMDQITMVLRVEEGYEGLHDPIGIDRLLDRRLQYKQVRLTNTNDRLWDSLYPNLLVTWDWTSELTRPDRLSTVLNKVLKQDVTDANKFRYDISQAKEVRRQDLKLYDRQKFDEVVKRLTTNSQNTSHISDAGAHLGIGLGSTLYDVLNHTEIYKDRYNATSNDNENGTNIILTRRDAEKLIQFLSDYIEIEGNIIKPKPIDVKLVNFGLFNTSSKLFSSIVYVKRRTKVHVMPLRCPYRYISRPFTDWLAGGYHRLSSRFDVFPKNLTIDLEVMKANMSAIESRLNPKLASLESRLNEKLVSVESRLNQKLVSIESKLNEKLVSIEPTMNDDLVLDATTMNDDLVLYATTMNEVKIQPYRSRTFNISANAKWTQNGVTVAGGHGNGSATNQLNWPEGLYVDDDQTVIAADWLNARIIQWKKGDTTNGQVAAGGNGQGNGLHQLNRPAGILIDKETNNLIICDYANRRVVRWSRRSGTTQGEILIDNIQCWGLAMDEQRYLYVSDAGKHEVRRYQLGEQNGTLVAGGNGQGDGLNQLKFPTYLFVDRQQKIYVSDNNNHRVMKWAKGEKEGIVVAGGQGQGKALTQLSYPLGIVVDTLGTLYVADQGNHRVMRWPQGAKQGSVIVDGNVEGAGAKQFGYLRGLSFDRRGNLYAVDENNHRVQRFSIT